MGIGHIHNAWLGLKYIQMQQSANHLPAASIHLKICNLHALWTILFPPFSKTKDIFIFLKFPTVNYLVWIINGTAWVISSFAHLDISSQK
jgi:hypothetical protein